jgi:malonyl-CoA O-methyltransferase
MAGINRQSVQKAFTLHAGEYDDHSIVQKRVVERLAEFLRASAVIPRRVLDIGSGTGMLLGEMIRIYPATDLVGLDLAFGMSLKARANLAARPLTNLLTGDAAALPFKDHSFDLVVSTSTFQWLDSLDRAFAEAFRVLAPGGCFVFALFGGETLHELRGSYRCAWETSGRGPEERTRSFHDASAVETELDRTGFINARVWSESEVEHHSDVPALLRSLKRIGAGNDVPLKSRGLAERRVMLEMMEIYRRKYVVDGLIPATYEVIYGHAITPSAAQST